MATTQPGPRLVPEPSPRPGEYVIRNRADDLAEYDQYKDAPMIDELRAASVSIFLNLARNKHDPIVKVTANPIPKPMVSGYVTFLSQIKGKTLSQLEASLGLATGMLSAGAMVYFVDALALESSNIVPRGTTDWSAGVTPRELHNIREANPSLKIGDSHPNYPPATVPILQMKIYRDASHDGRPKWIGPGGRL